MSDLLRQEELEVLESIYPDFVSNDTSKGETSGLPGSIKLEIPVEFDHPRTISIIDATPGSDGSALHTLSLSLLPPLLVHVILPDQYPLYAPPQLVSIRATSLWMPYTSQLQQLLLDKWQASEGVLYTWVEYINSGGFLEDLGLVTEYRMLQLPHSSPHLLAPLLTAFETSARSNEFKQNSYPCSICLSYSKGSKCLQLSCKHIFCRSCLEDYWGLFIKEGDVSKVGCPDPQCVKEGREADEEEVARVVTDEEVVRWRWCKEKAMMEKDPTITVCPRPLCQTLVPKPKIPEDEESGWHRFRECPSCSYSFCTFCKRTWHGPVSPCPISAYETLVLDYLALPEGSDGRRIIEQRFGRSTVAKMVAAYHEEQLLKKWIEESTTKCPGCAKNVEKSVGCNHMVCTCSMHFCYRCGMKLPASSPYVHFSTPGSACFNKLFDFSSEDQEWEPMDVL